MASSQAGAQRERGGGPLSESTQQRVAIGDEWSHYSLTGRRFACGPPLCLRGGVVCIHVGLRARKHREGNQANHAHTTLLLSC